MCSQYLLVSDEICLHTYTGCCRAADTTKQALGMLEVHFVNLLLSALIKEQECIRWVYYRILKFTGYCELWAHPHPSATWWASCSTPRWACCSSTYCSRLWPGWSTGFRSHLYAQESMVCSISHSHCTLTLVCVYVLLQESHSDHTTGWPSALCTWWSCWSWNLL